jgi:hypothetical protein
MNTDSVCYQRDSCNAHVHSQDHLSPSHEGRSPVLVACHETRPHAEILDCARHAQAVTTICALCTFRYRSRCGEWRLRECWQAITRAFLCELQPSFLRYLSLPLRVCPRVSRSATPHRVHSCARTPTILGVLHKVRAMACGCCVGRRFACYPLSSPWLTARN